MKVNTFVKYNFLADIWVIRNDPNNDVTSYYLLNSDMQVAMVSGRQSTTMFTRGGLEFGSRIKNVRNPRGQKLFAIPTQPGVPPEEYDMHVHSNDPVIDVYGNIVGYRQVLRKPQPTITDIKEFNEGEFE